MVLCLVGLAAFMPGNQGEANPLGSTPAQTTIHLTTPFENATIGKCSRNFAWQRTDTLEANKKALAAIHREGF
jgi:hypothetical protein